MNAVLHLLGELAASTPVPSPSPTGGLTVAPAAPIDVKIGETGEWFGPAIVLIVALIVDATAASSAAKRDRVAAIGSYCAALGFISIYEWSEAIQGWFDGSWSWMLAGSFLALAAHVMFVAVLIGDASKWTKRLGGKIGPKIGLNSNESNEVGKINGKLHVAAAVAACSYTLARGDAAWIPHTIGQALTGASAVVVNWIIERLGG
jgi:hypothetical protein